jgi:hypothetical protein
MQPLLGSLGMPLHNSLRAVFLILVTILVTACGGGGDTSNSSPAGEAAAFYASSTYQYTTGIVAQTVIPNNTKVVDVSSIKGWSISPALPAGLAFDSSNGSISGTPTANSATSTYGVTAVNSAGQLFSANLAIGVSSNILMNLGHVNPVQFIQFDTAHVLSQDSSGFWILWDYVTTAQIASGTALLGGGSSATPAPLALAGPTVVIQTNTGLELRSSATGAVIAEIPVRLSWWKLAIDGSYVCAGSTSQLSCWSPSGQPLFTKSGNYAIANVFTSPSALLVALGAAGNDVIETISSATWTSNIGPTFQGAFYAWFADGSSFLTTNAATGYVWEYSLATTLEGLVMLQPSAGQGHWIWTEGYDPNFFSNVLTVYPLNSATATANFVLPSYLFNQTTIVPIGTFIDSWPSQEGNVLDVIDLSGATPAQTNYTLLFPPSAFAAISPSQFMEGSSSGVLIDGSTPGAPRYFGYGAVTSMAGSTTRAVFSTASGSIFSYNTMTQAFEPTIDLGATWQLALSSNGSILAAASPNSLNIYAMPSEALINSLPGIPGYSPATIPDVSTLTLSGDGSTLGETQNGGPYRTLPAAPGPGTSKDAVLSAFGPILLSSDGTLAATSTYADYVLVDGSASTGIYQDGTLVATVLGWPVAWLDNNDLLVEVFSQTAENFPNPAIYSGATIYSATGTVVATPPIGPLLSFQVLSSDLIYWSNEVISLSNGATLWASGDPISGQPGLYMGAGGQSGAVAGSSVIFLSGNLVIAQPY